MGTIEEYLNSGGINEVYCLQIKYHWSYARGPVATKSLPEFYTNAPLKALSSNEDMDFLLVREVLERHGVPPTRITLEFDGYLVFNTATFNLWPSFSSLREMAADR